MILYIFQYFFKKIAKNKNIFSLEIVRPLKHKGSQFRLLQYYLHHHIRVPEGVLDFLWVYNFHT